MPNRSITQISLVVDDYDKAIEYFVNKLGFYLIEDNFIPDQNKRWVVVSPSKSFGPSLVLAKASNKEQEKAIGNQTGGRVFLFLNTDDFWSDYKAFKDQGVEFVREPQEHDYGTVAVFKDIFGNL